MVAGGMDMYTDLLNMIGRPRTPNWYWDLNPHFMYLLFFFACGMGHRQSHGFWVIVSWWNCSVWSVLQKNEDYRWVLHIYLVLFEELSTLHPDPDLFFWLHKVPIRVTIAQLQVAKCVRWNPIHPHHENLETSEFTSLWPTWREFLQWLERGNVKQITKSADLRRFWMIIVSIAIYLTLIIIRWLLFILWCWSLLVVSISLPHQQSNSKM